MPPHRNLPPQGATTHPFEKARVTPILTSFVLGTGSCGWLLALPRIPGAIVAWTPRWSATPHPRRGGRWQLGPPISSVSLPTRFLKIHRPWRSIEHSVTEKRYQQQGQKATSRQHRQRKCRLCKQQGPSLVMVYLQVSFYYPFPN